MMSVHCHLVLFHLGGGGGETVQHGRKFIVGDTGVPSFILGKQNTRQAAPRQQHSLGTWQQRRAGYRKKQENYAKTPRRASHRLCYDTPEEFPTR